MRPTSGDADPLRAAGRAGHPRRHVRLRRLLDEPELRSAAGQGDRPRTRRLRRSGPARCCARCASCTSAASTPTRRSCWPCSKHAVFRRGEATTTWVDEHAAELRHGRPRRDGGAAAASRLRRCRQTDRYPRAGLLPRGAGHRGATGQRRRWPGRPGPTPVPAPLQGTVVAIDVAVGDLVRPGQRLLVMEAMKMEHWSPRRPAGSCGWSWRRSAASCSRIVRCSSSRRDGLEALVEESAPRGIRNTRPDLQALFERRAFGPTSTGPTPSTPPRRGSADVREHIDLLMDRAPGSSTASWPRRGSAGAGRRRS